MPRPPVFCHAAALVLALLALAACDGDSPVEPPPTGELDPLIAFSYAPRSGPAHIAVVEPSGAGLRVVTGSTSDDYSPSWDADGRTLLFASWRDDLSRLYTTDLETGGEGTLIPTGPLHTYEGDWSPDGTRLAYETSDGPFVMNRDGSGVRALSEGASYDADPVWSPDGQWVAFTSLRDEVPEHPGLRRRALYIVRQNGTDVRRVAASIDSPINDPAWSPDGTRIVFEAYGEGSVGDLFVVTVATDVVERLTSTPQSENDPDWSPDGARIAFTRQIGDDRHIFTMRATGGDEKQLTFVAGEHSSPKYRPRQAR